MLVTALILFCAGLVLALSAGLYAKIKKVDVFGTEKASELIQSKTISLAEILSESPNSNYMKKLTKKEFSKIEIVSFSGDVVLKQSDSKTELKIDKANTNNLQYEIIGETLVVKEIEPVSFMGFFIDEKGISFQGLRHIFGSGNSVNSEKTITLTIKKGTELEEASLSSTVGNVTLDGVSAKQTKIKSGFGKVNVFNSQDCPDSKIEINGSFSSVELKNNLYTSCIISAKIGSVDALILEGENQSTVIDLWMGDANIKTKLPTKLYKLDLSTMLGNVERNKESCGKKLSEKSSTNSRITVGILSGNVSLSFDGKNEEDFELPETEIQEETETPTETAES